MRSNKLYLPLTSVCLLAAANSAIAEDWQYSPATAAAKNA